MPKRARVGRPRIRFTRPNLVRKGQSMIEKNIITGFQIEDTIPNKRSKLIYSHDNPSHIKEVRKNIGGKVTSRKSYFKWRKNWKAGINTVLLQKKTLAKAKEQNLTTENIKKGDKFIRARLIKGKSKNPLKESWVVPDVRIVNVKGKIRHYKNAFLVTRKSAKNKRFLTLVTSKKKVKEIKDILKYERVKLVKVQDYRPRKHSFWVFIKD